VCGTYNVGNVGRHNQMHWPKDIFMLATMKIRCTSQQQGQQQEERARWVY